jgi:tetraacyldisaccharide 4'-kinase
LLDLLYSQLARARRRYYQRRPHIRRRLAAPVISIGNLTVGGSGKTPLAAEIARMLVDMDERPSILSRGYAREIADDGVVIVSDGTRVLSDVARAGDEPLMLARMVPRAAVLVSSSRYLAGRLAEATLGCTVHILDDGFQHFDLMRDVDLLVSPENLDDTRTLPFGRFREPLDAAAAADALLVETGAGEGSMTDRLGTGPTFEFSRRIAGPSPDDSAYAFAGIARPERFYADLEKAGWRLTGRRSFRDHHRYTAREIEEVVQAAADSGAQVILTTEKDFVRLEYAQLKLRPTGVGDAQLKLRPTEIGNATRTGSAQLQLRLTITPVPLEVSLCPSFRPWLAERLRATREQGRRV